MELVMYYRTFLESLNKSPHTIKQYCIDGEQFLTFVQEQNKDLHSNIGTLVKDYVNHLKASYTTHTTINRKLSSLKSFLSYIHSRGLIQELPVEDVQPLKNNETKIKTLKEHQLKRIIRFWLSIYETSEDPEFRWIALRNFCIVRLIAELSLKPSELVTLKWTHVKGNIITIRSRKKIRKLEISSSMMEWFNIYRNETVQMFPLSNQVDAIWLGVGNKKYSPITVKTIERIFQSISKQLGLKVTATDIRYATINKEVVQQADQQLEIYKQFGYARKSVLKDRLKRFRNNEKIDVDKLLE
ncbi:site-specific integrase [Lysinibacillus sp. BW-2-10]|uniref:tyrosine-type recombinase/integrase n=1 Tax=Lysinibacillus sp. BW-2-10 TaxID=2590030 RepID=UPI001181076B|nr:site-specific integrase [Lysinibacillus sp. BW-2-10]TSI09736.1 recombinase XerD [Lysinibacillus sp. BW-2-10]